MRVITGTEIEGLMAEANLQTRRRFILRLHEHEEPVQRMVNAILPGSYIAPHKHEDPDKVELFSILRGRVAVLRFSPVLASRCLASSCFRPHCSTPHSRTV